MSGVTEGRRRRTAMRVTLGILLTTAGIGGGVAAALAPPVQIQREPLSITAQPEPAATRLACDGPILAGGRDAVDASVITDAAAQTVVAATADPQIDATLARLAAADVVGGEGPDSYTALPVGREPAELAAAGSATAEAEDLTGFAAAACTAPQMVSWLVGGSGLTGASDFIVIANPGEVAARVDLVVFAAGGPTVPTAGSGLLVPAGSQRVIPLASVALGEDSPVIRVDASEAPVRASLQTSITRTLVPGGVDQVSATAAPATEQVIPSFTVSASAASSSDGTTTLRVLAPDDDAEATIAIAPVGSAGAAAPMTVQLAAGEPLELELGDLSAGAYTVRVSATAPVVTAVWETTGFGAGEDIAWYTSASTLTDQSLVAVASGPDPILTLVNDGGDEIRVRYAAGAGIDAPGEIAVPGGGSVAVPVNGDDVYLISAAGESLRASITYAGDGALAGYAVAPSGAAASSVTVYTQ